MPSTNVYPAQNVLWFWFDQTTRRALHGTLADAARKLATLEAREFPLDGLEIFLTPSRLKLPLSPDETNFVSRYRDMPGRCVHIGEACPDFLLAPQAAQDLRNLAHVLDILETESIVIHAHHLRTNPDKAATMLLSTLPGIEIRIENNGFDAPWGSNPANVAGLLRSFPEFRFCLDIAHVEDFNAPGLSEFMSDPIFEERLSEIHFSYSTHRHERDPYEERGYAGYGPFHALYSVMGLRPDDALASYARNVPVVLEGIVPREDDHLSFLIEEMLLAGGMEDQ